MNNYNISSLYPFIIIATLSSSSVGSNDINSFITPSSNIQLNFNKSIVCENSSFYFEQYTPKPNFKDRYSRIFKSSQFKNAYENRSLGENLAIDL